MRSAARARRLNDNGAHDSIGRALSSVSIELINMRRRDVLKALGALTWAATPGSMRPAHAKSLAAAPAGGGLCAANAGSRPRFVPAGDGWLGRLAPGDGEVISLRAAPVAASRERGRGALGGALFAT